MSDDVTVEESDDVTPGMIVRAFDRDHAPRPELPSPLREAVESFARASAAYDLTVVEMEQARAAVWAAEVETGANSCGTKECYDHFHANHRRHLRA